jgi:PTH1 family peptidyl-tRNA hydrolase
MHRPTRFVIGLGNPGRRYSKTRHNVGFMVLKALRKRWDFGRARSKFHARVWTGRIGRVRVALAAPQTYMNRSGQAAGELAGFYQAEPAALLVVMDDTALPTGRLRARASGSAGGHKGLADVLAVLGTQAVPRLRVGISAPPPDGDAVEYVLSEFEPHEKRPMAEAVERAADAVEDWVRSGIRCVMDRYNAGSQAAAQTEPDEKSL